MEKLLYVHVKVVFRKGLEGDEMMARDGENEDPF